MSTSRLFHVPCPAGGVNEMYDAISQGIKDHFADLRYAEVVPMDRGEDPTEVFEVKLYRGHRLSVARILPGAGAAGGGSSSIGRISITQSQGEEGGARKTYGKPTVIAATASGQPCEMDMDQAKRAMRYSLTRLLNELCEEAAMQAPGAPMKRSRAEATAAAAERRARRMLQQTQQPMDTNDRMRRSLENLQILGRDARSQLATMADDHPARPFLLAADAGLREFQDAMREYQQSLRSCSRGGGV
jgi:hypothetical protein